MGRIGRGSQQHRQEGVDCMNRNEFISKLHNTLGDISPAAKDEIMYDYREHFDIGLEQGKTEEEICAGLGDPRSIAKQYRAEYMVNKADVDKTAFNALRAVFAGLSLGFFKLIFLAPVMAAIIGVLACFFVVTGGLVLGGIGLFTAILLAPLLPQWISIPDINPVILILCSISLISSGMLSGIGTVKLTKFAYKLIINFIRSNLKIINKHEMERENYV
jgi:uncharacterized membrane protein